MTEKTQIPDKFPKNYIPKVGDQLRGTIKKKVWAPKPLKETTKAPPIPYENKLLAIIMDELSFEGMKIKKQDISKITKCSVGSIYSLSSMKNSIARKVNFEIDWNNKLDELLGAVELTLSQEIKSRILEKINSLRIFNDPITSGGHSTTSDSDL